MEENRTIERHAANSAFVAALAAAVGDEALAQRFTDSMMRAFLLSRPLEARVIFDAGEK